MILARSTCRRVLRSILGAIAPQIDHGLSKRQAMLLLLIERPKRHPLRSGARSATPDCVINNPSLLSAPAAEPGSLRQPSPRSTDHG